MRHVDQQLTEAANTDGRKDLFSRTNKNGIRPGAIVLVETYNRPGETASQSFMGVCIAIRRKGINTHFTLRNMVMRVGVEQRFQLYSPLLKSIKVLPRPNEEKFRRAKLYYLREEPGKALQPMQSLWKQELLDRAKN
ncbi:50S ribosomal protein L19 [Mycotypha africana]|uniref:50S ribosomal protein L19 n=1 Tax=Mycotypha africana TaxID=64632 RepID=UPI00230112F0|nr:50S ribosomal protein L19 [Mycotypha africana]KAI8975296.1 50S ribosomal protein L19 [Mycotypha africana]